MSLQFDNDQRGMIAFKFKSSHVFGTVAQFNGIHGIEIIPDRQLLIGWNAVQIIVKASIITCHINDVKMKPLKLDTQLDDRFSVTLLPHKLLDIDVFGLKPVEQPPQSLQNLSLINEESSNNLLKNKNIIGLSRIDYVQQSLAQWTLKLSILLPPDRPKAVNTFGLIRLNAIASMPDLMNLTLVNNTLEAKFHAVFPVPVLSCELETNSIQRIRIQ